MAAAPLAAAPSRATPSWPACWRRRADPPRRPGEPGTKRRHLLLGHRPYHDTKAAALIALGEGVVSGAASYDEAATTLYNIKGGQWPGPDMHPAHGGPLRL